MKIIKTKYSDNNSGHYSPAISHNGVLYISGQLSINPEDGKVPVGGIEAETRQALKNINDILQAAGSNKDKILKVNVYIPDVKLWPQVNKVYAEFFGEHKPARIVVPSNNLYGGCLVEIDAIAAID